MSVVVRMEMPQNCCECQLRQEDYDAGEEFCPFTGVECLSIGRQDNCPIVCALPENHGRLVDADAAVNDIKYEILEYKMEGMKGTPMPTEHLWLTKNWIADEDICPTIVPAERSET